VSGISKSEIYESIGRLFDWLEKNDFRGYDTFDGLSAKYLRPLTFENNFLRIALQQSVRRFPLNLRPLLGIPRERSTKGMGFLARGFIRLHQATGDDTWAENAKTAFAWLVEHESPGWSGACWGNHFDYQSRDGFQPKGTPSVVWTSHIGHAFLDGYDHFKDESYLQVAVSACEHILRDLGAHVEGDEHCINYFPRFDGHIHNANTLGASLLARTYSHTGNEAYRSFARKGMAYTAKHQRANGSWYYGEAPNVHWVDNFHTGYVLDCFKYYEMATNDEEFDAKMNAGYQFWKDTFFLPDGTPRYYDYKTLPIDIQCASQAIDTLVFFNDRDPENLQLALSVAKWTIDNMQDRTGYFYYRRYSQRIVNKTPTLHWGQATMFCALTGLYKLL
jgi:rhamnogalacturonyl hydrolase YesR